MQDLGIRVLFEGNNLIRLLGGLFIAIKISFISILFSILLGTILGIIMVSKNKVIKVVTKIYLEFMRIMPQLVMLFIVYFGFAKTFNINLSGEVSSVIVFTLWGTAEMGDLVRSSIISIPKHQYNSSYALGLTNLQTYIFVIIPQTLRSLLPLSINLVTRMIKTTSLIVLIGVVEVFKVGQQIIEANRYTAKTSALWIYATIFFLYFIVCFPISKLSQRLEKRWQV